MPAVLIQDTSDGIVNRCRRRQNAAGHSFSNEYDVLEYNIQVLTIEMTGRKPLCIRVQITAVTSAFYFMPVLCVLYSKTLKR